MCILAQHQPFGLPQANDGDQVVLGIHIHTIHFAMLHGYGKVCTQIYWWIPHFLKDHLEEIRNSEAFSATLTFSNWEKGNLP